MILSPITGEIGSQERHEAKVKNVLEWTAEHGFSSIEVLSKLLGQSHKSTFRFFSRLINEEYLRRFKSSVLLRSDLVILGKNAPSVVASKSTAYLRRIMRADIFADKIRILHDYKLQEYLVTVADQYGNLLNERSIITRNAAGTKETICPDALLFGTETGYFTDLYSYNFTLEVPKPAQVEELEKASLYDDSRYLWVNEMAPVAVEFERTAKDRMPFYRAMEAYYNLVRLGKVKKVVFIVEKESTLQEYQNWFRALHWPEYSKDPKTGKVYKAGDKSYPVSHPFRACVEFVLTENFTPGATRNYKKFLASLPKSEDFAGG